MENKKIIEINGVKLEVDLTNAKVITNYKVGDMVKLLIKKYSDYESKLGIIAGFDNFKTHPTIVIAYLNVDYSGATIEFAYFNTESKDIEITTVNEWDIPFSKQSVLDKIDKEINGEEEKIRELQSRRAYFLNMFGKYFEKKQTL